MIQKFKHLIQITCYIFTFILLTQLLIGQTLTNQVIFQLLFISFTSSLLKVLLFKDILFQYNWHHQVGYLSIVWVLVVLANLYFHWQISSINILIYTATVIAVYMMIRFIHYTRDKKEANEMNLYLQKRNSDK